MSSGRFAWLAAPIAIGGFIALTWLERRRPLRQSVEPKLRRQARNLALAGLGAIALQFAEIPLARQLAALAEDRRWGLLQMVRMPYWAEIAAALLLMDYSMYIWHVLLHRAPFLWRFHLVHHVDLDLDASTALRFHFGELLASVPWRAAQVVLIGLRPATYAIWQAVFVASVAFHHSNLRFPVEWERRLNYFFVTPRMHGIHHSIVREETDSNWSSGLTLWDRLHGTLRLNVPQSQITIGVPAWREPQSVTRIVVMPFEPLPRVWQFPSGETPARHVTNEPLTRFLA